MGSLETQMANNKGFNVADVAGDVNEFGRVRVEKGNEIGEVSVWQLTAQTDQENYILDALRQTAQFIGFSALRKERLGYVIPGGAVQIGRVIDRTPYQA